MTATPEASDLIALRRLTDDYGMGVDTRDATRFASVFTSDGVLAVYEPDQDEPSLTYTGRQELETVVELVSNWSSTFHLMANFLCEVDGDTATGHIYGISLHFKEAGGKGEDTMMVMRYRDRYVREDGVWRIARRDVLRQWTEYHLAERARLADSQSR